jgi:hypothetical protein
MFSKMKAMLFLRTANRLIRDFDHYLITPYHPKNNQLKGKQQHSPYRESPDSRLGTLLDYPTTSSYGVILHIEYNIFDHPA